MAHGSNAKTRRGGIKVVCWTVERTISAYLHRVWALFDCKEVKDVPVPVSGYAPHAKDLPKKLPMALGAWKQV